MLYKEIDYTKGSEDIKNLDINNIDIIYHIKKCRDLLYEIYNI